VSEPCEGRKGCRERKVQTLCVLERGFLERDKREF